MVMIYPHSDFDGKDAGRGCGRSGVQSLGQSFGGLSGGKSQRNCALAKSEDNPGRPLPISLRWLECVDDQLSALAVKIFLSISPSRALGEIGKGEGKRCEGL
jgi:hypothetical protein